MFRKKYSSFGRRSGVFHKKVDRLPNLKTLTYSIDQSMISGQISRQRAKEYKEDSKTISTLKRMSKEVGAELQIDQFKRNSGQPPQG